MVKVKFLILSIILIGLNSCYKLIPKRYFNKYSKVLSEPLDTDKLDITKVYVVEDKFSSDYYSKLYNREIKSYVYRFFFRNHLTARLRIPVHRRSGEVILTQEDYLKMVKEKTTNDTEDYEWTYYSIKDSILTEYDLDYEVGNWNVLNFSKVVKRRYLLINNGLVHKDFYKMYRNDTTKLNLHFLKKSKLSFKPDSTKSDIYCRFTYKQKGYRRIYADNSPNYINPCAIIKKDSIK